MFQRREKPASSVAQCWKVRSCEEVTSRVREQGEGLAEGVAGSAMEVVMVEAGEELACGGETERDGEGGRG